MRQPFEHRLIDIDPSWREKMLRGEAVPTHDLSLPVINDVFAGIVVPSDAKGAAPAASNLVLRRWNEGSDCTLLLIDDENRLVRS